ncbi:hypothetical protein ACFOHS_02285 [Jhaorihella thermophila]
MDVSARTIVISLFLVLSGGTVFFSVMSKAGAGSTPISLPW